ncbi:MAG: DUF305 domain-containing protein [Microcystis sp. LE19-4.1E]|jgi:uncharacterized protein (DUF305 family)|nr:DUF305 domain-containing protein [Microcystis sp. LE19-4.1E]
MSIKAIAHRTAIALLLATAASTSSFAQNPHAGHGTAQPQGQQSPPNADMERMMRTMRDMMPMIERMRTASPQERPQMMERMAPMMREMMPMMHAMMGAQGMGMGAMTGPGHQGHGQQSANTTPSTRAFEEANAKMHRDMAINFSGNADVDFVRGMIPHHQGAIDMAKVVLQFGTNEQTKKWANDIIAAQEREIAEMREWLAKNAR